MNCTFCSEIRKIIFGLINYIQASSQKGLKFKNRNNNKNNNNSSGSNNNPLTIN